MHYWRTEVNITKKDILITFFAASLTFGASAQNNFDKQAHRGGRGVMPENTIAAMKYALDMGNTLEMDLSYSSDKKVIVSHDNYISSIFALDSNGNSISKEDEKKYRLYNLTYDQIRKFDVGMKSHIEFPEQIKIKAVIPLLTDLIDSVEAYGKLKKVKPRYNIEAKLAVPRNADTDLFREEFIASIMEIISKKKIQKRTILQSFDVGMLQIIHRDHPKVITSYLVGRNDLQINLQKLKFVPAIYSPIYTMVTKELVDECHKQNMKVIPWTVNTKSEIEKLKILGVDGIITDYPQLF